MKKSELRQLIREEINKISFQENLPKVISKNKKSSTFGMDFEKPGYTWMILLNDENFTTDSGLEFNLKTIGSMMTDEEEYNFNKTEQLPIYYLRTHVYYKGKKLIKGDGIPGASKHGEWNLNDSIDKAKRWLNKNGDDVIKGKNYQYKSS